MINKRDFWEINRQLNLLEKGRENLNKRSREIVRLSKKIVYALHQGETKKSQCLISQMKKEKRKMEEIARNERLISELGYQIASQEYAEAIFYHLFVKEERIASLKEVDVGVGAYLAGLSDFVGELFRRAVYLGIEGKFSEIKKIRKTVEAIHKEILFLELKGDLRKKFDSIKYNLMKLEDLTLEIKLRK